MYLKSVEMQGFKSFADKIFLDFNPGITAIVGPNGSGKSNISDAIRWVMGEQSIKSLRGSKMEDVIFAGTQQRKPLGYAEVSLTLDNSTGIFPIDYSEVTVTRRVYRSGEGEYFINKNSCRLKDIHELFMDTGLGREGYSIIGQGKIDEILSNKSEDRRQIFEEAAGITKYKYRKNEAERKLGHTAENLLRIKDIMSELEGQLNPLKEQSEKAKRFLNLRDELRLIEVNVSVKAIKQYREELSNIEISLKDTNSHIEKVKDEIAEIEQKISILYAKIDEYDRKLDDFREKEKLTVNSINDANNEMNIMLAKIEHCNDDIKRILFEEEENRKIIKEQNKNIAELSNEFERIKKQKDENLKNIQKTQEELYELKNISDEKKDILETVKMDIIDKTTEISRAKERIINFQMMSENYSERKNVVKKELEEQNQKYISFQAKISALKTQCEEKEMLLIHKRKDIDYQEELYAKQNYDYQNSLKEKNNISFELSQKTAKINILKEMEKDFEGYNRSVKNVMLAYNNGKINNATIHGPLSQLIKTDKKYAVAIEIALANANQNIVTDTEKDAKNIIEYLKRNNAGRVTFLPISAVKSRTLDNTLVSSMNGYIGVASDIVNCDEKYKEIVSSILGGTVVADTIDNAIKMANLTKHKLKIVTLEGELLQPGGAISGGSNGKSSGFFLRRAEISELSEAINRLNNEKEKNEELCIKKGNTLAELFEKITVSKNEVDSQNEEYIKIKAEFDNENKFFLSLSESREQAQLEVETIQTQIDNILNESLKMKKGIASLEKEIVTLKDKTGDYQEGFDVILKKIEQKESFLIKSNIENTALLKDLDFQRERLALSVSQKNELEKQSSQKNAELDKINAEITEFKSTINKKQTEVDKLEHISDSSKKELNCLTTNKIDADEKVKSYQKQLTDTRESLYLLSQQQSKEENRKIRFETELETITNRIWDEYELTYTEAIKACTDENIDVSKANREIGKLKGKIKELGNINIDAIDEYKNVKERFEFMTVQTNDLEKAKKELETVIIDMMSVMKKQFEEQLSIINNNFNMVFSELFGGGRANLYLSDPNDLLESGIEIEAQPPGKKLQSLTLLSGGERAFTAIALLFAILNVRPTPFCILDEIEAALDDVNVYRYADYLKKYCSKTQFIVVTHRRGTMESANILYGVTMQERGVSKLLSLNIDEVIE